MKKIYNLLSQTCCLFIVIVITFSSCEKSDNEPVMPDYDQTDPSDSEDNEDKGEIEDPSEVGYIVGDLRYQLTQGTKDECYVMGMAKFGVINHLTIPNTITIGGNVYRVTAIGKNANITAYSVETQANMNTINSYAFSSDLHQLIVGTNVKKVSSDAWNNGTGPYRTGQVSFDNGSWMDYKILSNEAKDKVSKIVWLPNTPPEGLSFNLGGKENYASVRYKLVDNVTQISELTSLFWVDGILYTLESPADRTCIAIGCDYDSNKEDWELNSEVTNQGISLKIINYGNYCFANNKNIKRISTGEMTQICNGTFMFCESIQKIDIGEEIERIGENAFYGCFLIPKVELGAKVSRLGENSFKGCTSIKEFILNGDSDNHEALEVYNSPLFSDCSLTSVVLNRNIEHIYGNSYSNLFQSISTLTTVRMVGYSTEVYDKEFQNCNNLEMVELGDRVSIIGKFSFSGCPKMESFTVGKAITKINDNAFSDCTGLKDFTTEALTPPSCGSQALQDIDKWKCTLYVPDESIELYKSAYQWKEFLFIE